MFFKLIEKRRSIRKFKQKKIERKKIDKLIEAALRAPSSRGFNPWRFIVIDNKDILYKLSESKPHGSSFLKDAALGIVVCGDIGKSDVWVEDTSIAAIFIQLAAESLELASCWIQIRKREHNKTLSANKYVKELLSIPDNMNVASIIAIGYPDEDKQGHTKESLQTEKIFYNNYS
ncbi:MAG: nitroreductase family protein [Desulfobacteraceae bacterium]|nr:nitroreductase family protein [Desulfobacteraceae bacterium]